LVLRKRNYHQRGADNMTQGALPFKYEEEKSGLGLTALAGLPVYLDMARVMDLSGSIDRHVVVRKDSQGWTDSQVVMALILLNIAGGDCVEDLKVLEQDGGFRQVLLNCRWHGKSRKERRKLLRRWRKQCKRAVPSPSAVFRYLSAFGIDYEAKAGSAVIPAPSSHIKGLVRVNQDLLSFMQRCRKQTVATLDMDATLVATHKSEALYCYKGFSAYQPLNTWWSEQGLVVHSEFRDGNVPAGYEQLRVFKEALECLPHDIERVQMRSDTAGYQHDLLKYCDSGEDPRFGRIEFAVGCPVSKEFKRAVEQVCEHDWQPLYIEKDGMKIASRRQWAEVCFVPNEIAKSKTGCNYHYLATREAMEEQQCLPGMDDDKQYPFATMTEQGRKYKVFGIVTNKDQPGNELINWLYERCGQSEEVHRAMKDDFAGGTLPCGGFGQNTAWWWIMLLALNLNAIMKRLVLGAQWATRKMKAIRYALVHIAGRIISHSRELIIRCGRELAWLIDIRSKIVRLGLI
jgi:hypothetical protein